MALTYDHGTPGIGTERTHTPRKITFGDPRLTAYLPGGKTIDGALSRDAQHTGDLDVLRPGLLMGKITTGGKYAPSIMGTAATAYTASATLLTVTAQTAVEINRRIGATGTFTMVGPPSAAGVVATTGGTYSAVNTTTGTLTITAITPG